MFDKIKKIAHYVSWRERFLLSLPALFILLIFFFVGSVTATSTTSPVSGHKIVIDPGHGGTDHGSTACEEYPEKEANLDVALKLKDLLMENGVNEGDIYLTREDNETTLSNRDRYEMANGTDGEVLLSIHLNGSSDKTVDGTLGLYGKRNKDLEFTKAVHANMSDDLSNNGFDVPDMGVTNFASGVLLKSEMPATIQETVFISNTDECAALKDGTGQRQQEIAQALFNGLENWFGQTQDDGGSDDGDDGNGNGNGRDCTEPPCNNK